MDTQLVQAQVDAILAELKVRIISGQMVIHFAEGRVQKVETNTIHKPSKRLDV